MGAYKLSEEARNDIANIYEYGIEKFGLTEAQSYLSGLHNILETISDHANIGRDASEFFPSLKQFVYKSHMIFYLSGNSVVFVARVLSQSMDYNRHL